MKFNIAVVYSFTQKDTIDMKIVALKYLPLLLSSLGSYSFHLINNILPGLLSCGEGVQVEIAKTIGSLACVLTENTVIKKLKNELPFHKSISGSITFLCPDCDSVIQNKAGNKLKWFWYNEIVNAVKKTHDLNDFRLKKAAFLTQNRLFSTDFRHFYALTSMQSQPLDITNNSNQRTERGILTNQTDQ